MSEPFFITGLPRTRTAWLANLFTDRVAFCHYELSLEVESTAELAERVKPDWHGDSDSGLVALYPALHARIPGAKWVLVMRDPEEAWKSLVDFARTGPYWEQLGLSLETKVRIAHMYGVIAPVMLNSPNCLGVKFEDLDRMDTLEAVWRHCLPEIRFDRDRAALLQRLRINPHQEKHPMRINEKLVKEITQQWELLGA